MLIQELAEKIVREVRKLLDEDIIVVSTDGFIMASTDSNRVGNYHEGALIACQRKDRIIITKEDQKVLKGVKAGINLPIFFKKDVVGVIGITGDPEKVSPYGEIIRKMTELLISESYYTEQIDWQSRSTEAFVLDWIQLKEWNDSFLNRAKLLNVDLHIDRRVIIAEVTQDSAMLHRDLWLSILSWNERNEQDIITRWGSNRVIYLLSHTQHNALSIKEKVQRFYSFLAEQLKTSIVVGVGQTVPPLYLHQSYHQAERALNARKTEQTIIFDEDLTLEMILDEVSEYTKAEFIRRTIKPLLTEQELITTLKTLFINHFSLKKTASALHIHINTLHYRLKKITEYTNLDTRNVDDLFILYLAFRFLDKYTIK